MTPTRLKLVPPRMTEAERETLLFRTKTMAEIRDAADWLQIPFAQAYRERAEVWRARYRFL